MNKNSSASTEGKPLITNLKKLWKNEYFQTAVMILLIVLIVFGFWYGSQLALNTPYPALAVVTGSMCVPQGSQCDGRYHPFTHTLHVGDMIILQGVNPADLSDDYPNSDIIVFHKPTNPSELIVHRIVAMEERDGKIYFFTKGDGNGIHKWPSIPQTAEYDPWEVPEDLVVGKVILRIPWIGHSVLFMHDPVGMPIVITLIILLLIVGFIIPLFKDKAPVEQKTNPKQEP